MNMRKSPEKLTPTHSAQENLSATNTHEQDLRLEAEPTLDSAALDRASEIRNELESKDPAKARDFVLSKLDTVSIGDSSFERYAIKTPLIKKGDDIIEIVTKATDNKLGEDDAIFVSERIVAIAQGRSFPISEIKPSWWAEKLSKRVYKSPHGIGLGSPWTMELAIREAGLPRILFASAASVIAKLFGIRGTFYRVVGHNINAIDGPCENTIPPYNTHAKLGPLKPNRIALDLANKLGHDVFIIDANDIGVNVLGKSNRLIPDSFVKTLFADNPLGQNDERTPICIVRKQ